MPSSGTPWTHLVQQEPQARCGGDHDLVLAKHLLHNAHVCEPSHHRYHQPHHLPDLMQHEALTLEHITDIFHLYVIFSDTGYTIKICQVSILYTLTQELQYFIYTDSE